MLLSKLIIIETVIMLYRTKTLCYEFVKQNVVAIEEARRRNELSIAVSRSHNGNKTNLKAYKHDDLWLMNPHKIAKNS